MEDNFNKEAADRIWRMWRNLGDSLIAYVEGGSECMDSIEMAKDCIKMAELAQICYRNATQYANGLPLELDDPIQE